MSTPEDLKALETIAAEQAAGRDPFGDDEPLVSEADADADPGTADQPEAMPDEPVAGSKPEEVPTEPAQSAGESKPETETEPEPEPEPQPAASKDAAEVLTYKAEVPSDYKAQRTDLLKAKAEAMKKLLDGQITAEDYAAEEVRVTEALEDLAASRIRAETLQEANAQSQGAYQARAIQRLISNTKNEVDYATDAVAQKQFDTSLQVLAAQPDNAGRDFADLIEDAHQMVKAMRGVKSAPAQAPAPAPTPVVRKPEGEAPVTLRGVPSASTPNTGGVIEQMARLKGQAYEAAFDKLTPAQKAALLDAD